MPKAPTLPTITGQYASATQLNAAFRDIETSFENTVSRDGSTPNTMSGNLDMNSNNITNVNNVTVTGTLTVGGSNLSSLVTAAAEATASAAAAAVSETNAAASEAYVAGVEATLPEWQGAWLTATAYATGDLVQESGNTYICVVAHTSGTFATDLAAIKWQIFAQKGSAGAGTGDMLAANNLSDLVNKPVALVNLGLTATAAELNTLDGITASVAELNTLDGITASVSELNVLDGITSTVTELNHTDGVTSNIQTQLDTKAPLASPTFTGTPAAPTATAGTNTTQVATTAFVTTAVAGVGSTGGTEFISTQDFAGTATGDFVLPSGYDAYKLVFANVVPASAADLWVRTSTDGGSIYDTGGSAYIWGHTYTQLDTGPVVTLAGDEADSKIVMASSLGTNAGEDGFSGELTVYGPHLVKRTMMRYTGLYYPSSGSVLMVDGAGVRAAAEDVDAIRILFSTGNIESGTITLYGMVNA